ncbi:alanine--tRNA ligase [Candidatus Daviesbacteria bacterium]|nr:alanine--tRNA ligase [Candidatus Daviesbacteria bacterium]
MNSDNLREKFLKFFARCGHVIIPSASLIPSAEEQLAGKEKVLFTSAGMQPLIPYLLGKPHPQGKRLADVQKCLRTDDIEEVGDAVHNTFFEMLGNWSLGAYWKDEAIRLSFEFLTKELEISIEKLAVSVFAGDENTPKDEESARVWESLGIPKDRIFYFGKEYNWWPTGEKSGPCGPDTEMFYWTGEGEPAGKPNENSLWVEIWNDVFMQFNRQDDGMLEELKQKNVDTGMGLERTLAVLNGKKNNYQTDLFEPIMQMIEKVTGKVYGQDDWDTVRFRIIADHVKGATFLIGDGVRPSNKDRGYILRRLVRRAAMQLHLLKKITNEKDFISISDAVIEIYGGFYFLDSEHQRKIVAEEIGAEISKFIKTIEKGLQVYKKTGQVVSGQEAFFLFQSFGFPLELTMDLAKEDGKMIDKEGFEKEFKKHQAISRGE